jgi:tRNA A37 threonylcarbamoyladenosine dehydratase
MLAREPSSAAEISDRELRFGGIERLYGRGALERLARAQVCGVGLGGVGSWTVEALARSGIGALTLVDLDDVCVTNINRQIHAVDGAVGRPKAEVLAERVRAIQPDCRVTVRTEFFTEATADALLASTRFAYVVDAIDSLKDKLQMIVRCRAAGVPIVTCGGAGGRSDPTQVRVNDLAFSERDPLLRYVRKRLRERHAFSRDSTQTWGVPCVFSLEFPAYPQADGTVCAEKPKVRDRDELAINCAGGVGTASFVTGAFGFAAAGVVVRALASS